MPPYIVSNTQPPSTITATAVDGEPGTVPGLDEEQSHPQHQDLTEETQRLLVLAGSAGEEVRAELLDQVVTSHLWLADGIARRYAGRGEDTDDLIQIARAGLVEAAHRYDAGYGSFPAFAVPTINGVLKRHFRDHGWLIRPPRPTQETVIQINREWSQLTQAIGREPDERAVATRIGQPVEAVREARLASCGYSPASLDSAMSAGVSFVADAEPDLDRAEARIVVAKAWPQLSTDERRLLTMRYFEDRSQSDIAAEIGTSQMQVSRLLRRTLRKLRALIAGSEISPLAS